MSLSARTLLRVGKCAPLSRGDSSLDRSHSQICGTSLIFRLAVANNQAPMSVNQFSLDEFVFMRTQDAGHSPSMYVWTERYVPSPLAQKIMQQDHNSQPELMIIFAPAPSPSIAAGHTDSAVSESVRPSFPFVSQLFQFE